MTQIYWTPSDYAQTQCGQLFPQIPDYAQLHHWSVTHLDEFWAQLMDKFGVIYQGSLTPSRSQNTSLWPVPKWFPNVTLNFAQNVLNLCSPNQALIYVQENNPPLTITMAELKFKTAQLAAWMKRVGVLPGDVVAGLLSNTPEAIIGMLATASCGATWTVCSPDAGVQFISDRLEQTNPKILITSSTYQYGNTPYDISEKTRALIENISTLEHVVMVGESTDLPKATLFSDLVNETLPVPELHFEPVAFSSPLYILFSSGTTGKPKAIVHSVGGTLLQHLKEHRLQCDLAPGDRLMYYTTTSWMMWHWMTTALASGITVVLFDGKPDPELVWGIVGRLQITAFGTSAPWLSICQKSKVSIPAKLPHLKLILSTGAPLLSEQFDYLYTQIQTPFQLASISGGTDIVSCFAGGGPVPVQRGRLQCIGLGMSVEIWDESGQPIWGKPGELVCTQPFVCMPIYFLNDPDGEKYRTAYFDHFPGIWAHGDDAILFEDLSFQIMGRSDTTIKKNGVRIGTSDIYNALAKHPDIEDALAVGKRVQDNEEIYLFIKCKPNKILDGKMTKEIRQLIMAQSVWLKPDRILSVSDIPYTTNGKKSEQLIKNLLNGKAITNLSVLRNPECVEEFSRV